jgi:hypothetical protein
MDTEFLAKVENSKSKMKAAQKTIAEEQNKLYDLVKSRGYKIFGNVYVHPDYWEEYGKHSYRGNYPEGAIIVYSL